MSKRHEQLLGKGSDLLSDSWIEPPQSNEIEVSIFGPGKGESILIHLGDSKWMLVDSCVDAKTKSLPALDYLQGMGIDVGGDVVSIVATHAHDDHFAGISTVFERCEAATLVISQAACSEDFLTVIELDNPLRSLLRDSAYSEYRRIYEIAEERFEKTGRSSLKRAVQDLPLVTLSFEDLGFASRVTALSPSHLSVTLAQKTIAQVLNSEIDERRRLLQVDQNGFSIALWVDAGGRSLLLGADLTIGPEGCGWLAILENHATSRKASVFKIAHHGSPNAYHPDLWTSMLEPEPIALLAPFRGGPRARPATEDIERILGHTQSAYLTASPRVPAQANRIRRAAATLGPLARNLREPWGRVGQVRARGLVGEQSWDIRMRGPARRLQDVGLD